MFHLFSKWITLRRQLKKKKISDGIEFEVVYQLGQVVDFGVTTLTKARDEILAEKMVAASELLSDSRTSLESCVEEL